MTPIQPGDRVSCHTGSRTQEGTYITDRDGYSVVKLKNGYNIGVLPGSVTYLGPAPPTPTVETKIEQDPSLPLLAIISTGGTIASRVDYRTGAVTSQFRAEDILRAVPGLRKIARFRARQVATILSENMTPAIWQELARAILDEIQSGATGVIVTHGTDTMTYTAAAVSFMLETPVPVIFVGAQRSEDRPSSDSTMNTLCSAAAAVSDLSGVSVVMHAGPSDDRCAIHRATRVRKMHTSRRDAFRSIGEEPAGMVEYPSLSVSLGSDTPRRGPGNALLREHIEERCALLWFQPGMPPSVLDGYRAMRGLVIAGTGLGHVSSQWVELLAGRVKAGCTVVMTSQCLHGRVCDRVYDTGRDLLAAGVIEGADMLPEVALVKLMWVLGNTTDPAEVRDLMQADLKGELSGRRRYD